MHRWFLATFFLFPLSPARAECPDFSGFYQCEVKAPNGSLRQETVSVHQTPQEIEVRNSAEPSAAPIKLSLIKPTPKVVKILDADIRVTWDVTCRGSHLSATTRPVFLLDAVTQFKKTTDGYVSTETDFAGEVTVRVCRKR